MMKIKLKPSSISRLQNNPRPCMCDLYTPTDALEVSFSCLNLIAAGKVARRLKNKLNL